MPKINLEIYTPEKPIFTGEVDSLVIPAARGQMGILPGHIDMVVGLTPGRIKIMQHGGFELLAVTGGLARIGGKRVIIFAGTAELAFEISKEESNDIPKQ